MVGKSRIAKIVTKGCGKGFGKKPLKGKAKQETEKTREWMKTHRA